MLESLSFALRSWKPLKYPLIAGFVQQNGLIYCDLFGLVPAICSYYVSSNPTKRVVSS